MKVAVINFAGNVGKTTSRVICWRRACKAPNSSRSKASTPTKASRLPCETASFAVLQEYLQTVDNVVVDIGASNVEDLLALMRKYPGSHEDFDHFVTPTVPALKQQRDTIATLAELAQLGIPLERLVFDLVKDDTRVSEAFDTVLSFVKEHPVTRASTECRI